MRRRTTPNWSDIAAALAAELPRERLHPSVLTWVETNFRSRTPWYIALSGGADSVALLLLVWAHWPKQRSRLCALHFDHQMRGAVAARGDRQFCRDLCAALRVPLKVGVWRRTAAQRGNRREQHISEERARLARMMFFAEYSRVLWLGHQQDDVAETLLMRISRGSGTAGLSAPRPVQKFDDGRVHLRPLITLKKAEIAAALRRLGASWREDASNADDGYFRNRIRSAVMPLWSKAATSRDAIAGAELSRALLEEDHLALEAWLAELAPINRKRQLELRKIAGKPRAIVRRAVVRWLTSHRAVFRLSRQAVEALVTAVEVGRSTRHSLGSEHFAVLGRGVLRVEARKGGEKFQRRVN